MLPPPTPPEPAALPLPPAVDLQPLCTALQGGLLQVLVLLNQLAAKAELNTEFPSGDFLQASAEVLQPADVEAFLGAVQQQVQRALSQPASKKVGGLLLTELEQHLDRQQEKANSVFAALSMFGKAAQAMMDFPALPPALDLSQKMMNMEVAMSILQQQVDQGVAQLEARLKVQLEEPVTTAQLEVLEEEQQIMQDEMVKCTELMVQAKENPALIPQLAATLREAEERIMCPKSAMKADKACQTTPCSVKAKPSAARADKGPSGDPALQIQAVPAVPLNPMQKTLEMIEKLLVLAIPGSSCLVQLQELMGDVKKLMSDHEPTRRSYKPYVQDDPKAVEQFRQWQVGKKAAIIKHKLVMENLFGVLKSSMVRDMQEAQPRRMENVSITGTLAIRGRPALATTGPGSPSSSPSTRESCSAASPMVAGPGSPSTFSTPFAREMAAARCSARLMPLRSPSHVGEERDTFTSLPINLTVHNSSPHRESFTSVTGDPGHRKRLDLPSVDTGSQQDGWMDSPTSTMSSTSPRIQVSRGADNQRSPRVSIVREQRHRHALGVKLEPLQLRSLSDFVD
eukprot:GGOE01058112.1.p1 GENE.GGOE01058112.1~~GGOE01058112.1.p1  ORF type:complete len:569 (-),score=180.40 GGOE01058112.1:816-2522(-)